MQILDLFHNFCLVIPPSMCKRVRCQLLCSRYSKAIYHVLSLCNCKQPDERCGWCDRCLGQGHRWPQALGPIAFAGGMLARTRLQQTRPAATAAKASSLPFSPGVSGPSTDSTPFLAPQPTSPRFAGHVWNRQAAPNRRLRRHLVQEHRCEHEGEGRIQVVNQLGGGD